MLFLVAVAAGVIAGLVTRGSIDGLTRINVRWIAVVIIALVVRVATVLPPLRSIEGMQYLYLFSFVLLVGWCVVNMSRLPGLAIVAAGAAMNLLVIAANAGRMPVSLAVRADVRVYTTMTSGTRLNWLGDGIVLPSSLGGSVWGVYSAGDLVIAVGVAVVAYLLTHDRPNLNLASEKPLDV